MKMLKHYPAKDYEQTIEDSDDDWTVLPKLKPVNFVDDKDKERKRRIHDIEKKYNLGPMSTFYEI